MQIQISKKVQKNILKRFSKIAEFASAILLTPVALFQQQIQRNIWKWQNMDYINE